MAIQSYLKKQTNKNLKQHNFTPKTTMERRTNKTPFQQKKTKIREEISEIDKENNSKDQ